MSEADTELDELPEGWQWRRVGELAISITNGFACGGHNRTGTGVAHLRPMNVSPDFAIDLSDTVSIAAEDAPAGLVIEKGDVLFTNTSSQSVVGKSAVYDLPTPRAFSNHMTRIRLRRELIEPQWLVSMFWLLWKRGEFQSLCRNHVNQSSISRSTLHDLFIATPEVGEQRRILATLEPMLVETEAQRVRLDRLRGMVARTRRCVLAAAFRGALTSGWRTRHPEIADGETVLKRILSERAGTIINVAATARRPFKRPDPARVDDELGTLPSTWTWAPVEALGELSLGKKRSPEFHSGPLMRPYLRVANIKTGGRIDLDSVLSMNFEAHEEEHFSLRDGDILLSEGQSLELVGQSAIFREGPKGLCFQMTLQRFRRWASAPSSEFMQYVFSHYVVNGIFPRYASMTVNIAHLTLERLKPVPVPLPPVEEQEEIVRVVDHWFAVLDDVERRITRGLALCDRLRESLLQKAFRGELLPAPSPTSP